MGTAPRLRQVTPIDLARASGKDRFLVEVDGVICFYAEKGVNPPADLSWNNNPWVLYRFDEESGKKRLDADLDSQNLLDNIRVGAYDQHAFGTDL